MGVPCEDEQPVVVGLPAHVHWSHSLQCVHHFQLPAGGCAQGLDHHSRGERWCPLPALCHPVSVLRNFCFERKGCQYVPASAPAPARAPAPAPASAPAPALLPLC